MISSSKIRPNISITTDVIVGFPGEDDSLFEETIDTINKIKFSKIHVFPFSLRKGTKAEFLDGMVNEGIKKERVKKLLELSKKLEMDYFSKYINKKVEFLPEIYKNGYIIGHTDNYLLIKCKGTIDDLNNLKEVVVTSIDYPYLLVYKINY